MLEKIINFIKGLFKTEKQQYIEAPREVEESITNVKLQENFDNRIIVHNEEEERILQLQKDFKAGLIEEEDLSEEDFDALTNLYESQIEKTKKSIERYKSKIMSIKSQLA